MPGEAAKRRSGVPRRREEYDTDKEDNTGVSIQVTEWGMIQVDSSYFKLIQVNSS